MTDHPPECSCCRTFAGTPGDVENRPGLSTIAYRVGTHGEFAASMVDALTDEHRPALRALTTRDSDDFTIALLDSWAVVCDVLTFYNERLANESYLRTARERISLQELGRLIGYRLHRGAAAQTHVAFAMEPPPPIPAELASEPGAAPAVVPTEVILGAGLRLQSIPGPDEMPQTFETVEEIAARPEWNAMPATTTIDAKPVFGDTSAWLGGTGVNVQPGDVFLLAPTNLTAGPISNERWDVRVVTEAIADVAADTTEVRWAEGLGSVSPFKEPPANPTAYILRKRIGVFGANAPAWQAMSADFKTNYDSSATGQWPDFMIGPSETKPIVDLDGSHPDVVIGSIVVLARGDNRELFTVAEVEERSRADFAISGKVTRLTLANGENFDSFRTNPRRTVVLAVSEAVPLALPPDTSSVEGNTVTVDTDVEGLAEGRSVIVAGTTIDGDNHAETVALTAVEPGLPSTLTFDRDLEHVYERGTVVVHGNVALATHGETVTDVLGSGDATRSFARFPLAQTPLTYVQSTDSSGVASTLEVRVNDVAWSEAATMFGTGPDDPMHTVGPDQDGATMVGFGDGVNGRRLPTGNLNVRATYRKGLGAAGNVGAASLSQMLDRPLGAKGVTNPTAAVGGIDPEPETNARRSMPLNVKTLGRAVSLLDYADFARAYTGVEKAQAVVLPVRGTRTIVVSVAFAQGSGGATPDRLQALQSALSDHGDPGVAVAVVGHRPQRFRLSLRVAVDPVYESDLVLAAVEVALRDAFSFDARELGTAVNMSEVVAAAHTVAGVDAVDVDSLYLGAAAGLADRLTPFAPKINAAGDPLGAGLIAIDSDPFDQLVVLS